MRVSYRKPAKGVGRHLRRSARQVRTAAADLVQKQVTNRLLSGLPNASRYRLRQWAGRAAAVGKSKDFRVLDAGAGSAPYRDLFDHVTYETADFAQLKGRDYGQLDHVC